jgi:hypothetical protein
VRAESRTVAAAGVGQIATGVTDAAPPPALGDAAGPVQPPAVSAVLIAAAPAAAPKRGAAGRVRRSVITAVGGAGGSLHGAGATRVPAACSEPETRATAGPPQLPIPLTLAGLGGTRHASRSGERLATRSHEPDLGDLMRHRPCPGRRSHPGAHPVHPG